MKLTNLQIEMYTKRLQQHNKQMKQQNRLNEMMTFVEYVDYVYGKLKPLQSDKNVILFQHRETPHYPSHKPTNLSPMAGMRQEIPTYSGNLVTGIATMHKSNAVPVINQQQAIEIAKMRRG